jgi:hypothetical protein
MESSTICCLQLSFLPIGYLEQKKEEKEKEKGRGHCIWQHPPGVGQS